MKADESKAIADVYAVANILILEGVFFVLAPAAIICVTLLVEPPVACNAIGGVVIWPVALPIWQLVGDFAGGRSGRMGRQDSS